MKIQVKKGSKDKLNVEFLLREHDDSMVELIAYVPTTDDEWFVATITSKGMKLEEDIPDNLEFAVGPDGKIKLYT